MNEPERLTVSSDNVLSLNSIFGKVDAKSSNAKEVVIPVNRNNDQDNKNRLSLLIAILLSVITGLVTWSFRRSWSKSPTMSSDWNLPLGLIQMIMNSYSIASIFPLIRPQYTDVQRIYMGCGVISISGLLILTSRSNNISIFQVILDLFYYLAIFVLSKCSMDVGTKWVMLISTIMFTSTLTLDHFTTKMEDVQDKVSALYPMIEIMMLIGSIYLVMDIKTTVLQHNSDYIFISYSGISFEHIKQISNHYTGRLFYDKMERSGEMSSKIMDEIENCTKFLMLIDINYLTSRSCFAEFLYAFDKKKDIRVQMLIKQDRIDNFVEEFEGFLGQIRVSKFFANMKSRLNDQNLMKADCGFMIKYISRIAKVDYNFYEDDRIMRFEQCIL